MNFALINPKVWLELAIVGIIGLAAWYGYNAIYDRGATSVQTKWDEQQRQQDIASAKVQADALAVTKSLQDAANKQREISNAQITALNSHLASALTSLQQRPSRSDPSGLPQNPASGAGCTPSQLFREDASVALKLAGEADNLRIALSACRQAYDRAFDALK